MKRFLAIVLTLAMLLSMAPLAGLATHAHAESAAEPDAPFYGLGWSDISRKEYGNLDGLECISVNVNEIESVRQINDECTEITFKSGRQISAAESFRHISIFIR